MGKCFLLNPHIRWHPYFNRLIQAKGTINFISQAGYQLKISGTYVPRKKVSKATVLEGWIILELSDKIHNFSLQEVLIKSCVLRKELKDFTNYYQKNLKQIAGIWVVLINYAYLSKKANHSHLGLIVWEDLTFIAQIIFNLFQVSLQYSLILWTIPSQDFSWCQVRVSSSTIFSI